MYDESRKADRGTYPLDVLNNYFVTNTKGEDGSIRNVQGSQYWNTNAEDDGSGDNVGFANFAGKGDATKNSEGPFKDGDYEIHIVLADLVNGNQDIVAGKVRVNIFARGACAELGGGAEAQGVASALYTADSTPWLSDLTGTWV